MTHVLWYKKKIKLQKKLQFKQNISQFTLPKPIINQKHKQAHIILIILFNFLSTKGYTAFQLVGDNIYFYETKLQHREKWEDIKLYNHKALLRNTAENILSKP